jgi:outer membrane protein assembly factor BamB
VPGKGFHNLLLTATMHNSVYAFDADTGALIWQVNLGTAVSTNHFGLSDIKPEIGILGTPVIDLQSQVMYVVAYIVNDGAYSYWLHAQDLATGAERMDGPVEITAAVAGNGQGSDDNGMLAFDPAQHLQRPALLLLNGNVYVAFGSHEDQNPYHGWIMAYSANDLSRQTSVLNTTAGGGGGSIWQGGRGMAADDDGNIFAIAANGDTDGSTNFGESFLRLTDNSSRVAAYRRRLSITPTRRLTANSGLAVADHFTPADWNQMDSGDLDLGSAGPILVPGTKMMIGASKLGMIYVVDRWNMGGLWDGTSPGAQMFQASRTWIFNLALWTSPTGPILYVQGEGNGLKAYCVVNQLSSQPFSTTPCASNSSATVNAKGGMVVSANGSTIGSGILWTTTKSPSADNPSAGALHAFDASDVSQELWNSDLNGTSDALGNFAKFGTPTVVAGKVYVPTFSGQVAVYGLK